MKQKIKIVGYPRAGNQYLISLIYYLLETQDEWREHRDEWSGVWHSHDINSDEEIESPILYLCRDPLCTIYSRKIANQRASKWGFEQEIDTTSLMREYRKHLKKYYNENNFIIKYRSIVGSRPRCGYEKLTPMTDRINTFQKIFAFLKLPKINNSNLNTALGVVNKQYVIDKIKDSNRYYYEKFLLKASYDQERKEFINTNKKLFYEYFNDYEEMFDE